MRGVRQRIEDALRDELEKIANEVVVDMRRLAPEASGDLRESIKWTWGSAPRGSLSLGRVAQTENDRLRITIYAGGGAQFYARFQEFGTKDMPANPFFFPAWRSNRRRVRSRLTRRLKKAAKEV